MSDTASLSASALALQAEYLDTLRGGVRAHPRSAQTLIGPSEIGNPCARALLHRLNGDRPPEKFEPAWAPAVGTALHAAAEEWFEARSLSEEMRGRWLTEQRVIVGTIGGQQISGSTDLWDEWAHAVVDHKFVGPSKMGAIRKDIDATKGPGDQYRVQSHLYGKGWEDAGKRVLIVMIAFVPRGDDGLSKLGDTVFWWEPYNRRRAQDALDRANALYNLMTVFGIENAVSGFEPCTQPYCDWCGTGTLGLNMNNPTLRKFTHQ